MKISFIGVGSAFTSYDYWQSNLLITTGDGHNMLIDCGSDARFALLPFGIDHHNLAHKIEAVYISHLHADHIGGLEWLAFVSYFTPGAHHPRLFIEESLLPALWKHSLRGGLEWIQGRRMALTDYFQLSPVRAGVPFQWRGAVFTPILMEHILGSLETTVYSFGLIIRYQNKRVFFSSDTRFNPILLEKIAKQVEIIFHDCETSAFPSTVHSHYNELCTLPLSIKKKCGCTIINPCPPRIPLRMDFVDLFREVRNFYYLKKSHKKNAELC
ncbi:MAG: MBL fold metallo-hydrolase [Magnetococcus sp. DMHC-6]